MRRGRRCIRSIIRSGNSNASIPARRYGAGTSIAGNSKKDFDFSKRKKKQRLERQAHARKRKPIDWKAEAKAYAAHVHQLAMEAYEARKMQRMRSLLRPARTGPMPILQTGLPADGLCAGRCYCAPCVVCFDINHNHLTQA